MARQKSDNTKASPPYAKICQESRSTAQESIKPVIENHSNDSDSQDSSPEGKVENATHGKLWVTGAITTKPTPTYTGTKIIGIGTMHKSNAVPIFSDDEAKEISSMRR